MRIDYQPLQKLSAKESQPFASLTVAVVSEKAFSSGKWDAPFPSAVRERIDGAVSRLRSPLKAGSRLTVQGRARGEEDLVIALLPERAEMYGLLEFARD